MKMSNGSVIIILEIAHILFKTPHHGSPCLQALIILSMVSVMERSTKFETSKMSGWVGIGSRRKAKLSENWPGQMTRPRLLSLNKTTAGVQAARVAQKSWRLGSYTDIQIIPGAFF